MLFLCALVCVLCSQGLVCICKYVFCVCMYLHQQGRLGSVKEKNRVDLCSFVCFGANLGD
ncbi:hypothetical protein KP509_17G002400 [Ceratopteris richardii]|uniref:Uncharacterized protein n=1 Tax=Ceratopteris richardii TaxID=49495 RepID=A0A8T2SV24_CERRI|nr:hypothetical protein KP509_17G002400 [Ceratopteris richardii]